MPPTARVGLYLTDNSTSGVGQYILGANAGWSNEHGGCVTGLS